MSGYQIRHALPADRAAIISFMNTHWGSEHPLVNNPVFFQYYYMPTPGVLQFCLSEDEEGIAALCGYIRAGAGENASVWVSIWCARKNARGAGLALMGEMQALTKCDCLACNNIRANTMPFYTFLGYTARRLPHFYRLADKATYTVAHVAEKPVNANCATPPAGCEQSTNSAVTQAQATQPTGCTKQVAGSTRRAPAPLLAAQGGRAGNSPAAAHKPANTPLLVPIHTLADLAGRFTPPTGTYPTKDLWYIGRRYFEYPFPQQEYLVYGVPGESSHFDALLVLRCVPVERVNVLRLVDYIGPPALFGTLGPAISQVMAHFAAEYIDCYCYGIPPAIFEQAGFCERLPDSANIIPNYLTPILRENTEYYFFTSEENSFTLFKADGDQDRPNLK
ncbi:hypothetical protein LJB77_01765 [Ruminococcaceae bacterium OttesenSCG-928-N02]|nr:hypothetical protein [Ruminococcaceae bacterium OttesenSCG-928-N02]